MITELNSTPSYDQHYDEITLKENYKKENDEQISDTYFNCFGDCIKSENESESEEINENSEMLIGEIKIEENIPKKYTKESNNKSEIKSQKKKNKNEEKIFLNLESMNDIYNSEKSYLDFILTDNVEKVFNNCEEKKVILEQNEIFKRKEKIEKNLTIEKINDIKEKKKNKIFDITKKRKIFKVFNPNEFYIFNCGNKDKCTRKIINEILKKKKFIVKENKENSVIIIIKQNRKYDADNIRKKIKARFLKYLKNAINERLIEAGSDYCFGFLPQNFICNITKDINRGVLNLTLKEVFSKNFFVNINEESSSLEKYDHNQKVLDYLKNKPNISEMSNFNKFKDMKYFEIYYEYLRSNEFEKEINRLKKKENIEYIKLYIQLASNLIDFFLKE